MYLLRYKLTKWWFWIVIALSFSIGTGGWGLLQLLQLPALPDCLSESWLNNSTTSVVFYCAQTITDEKDVDKLSTAIELVNSLPHSHPQRAMAESLIEQWSQAILDLGENAFQQGELDKAVNIAQQVPVNVPAHQLVDKRIKEWNSIWSKAGEIYETALGKMNQDDQENSYLAFTTAKELLNLGNDYWATTKYQELVAQIHDFREHKEQDEQEKEFADNALQAEISESEDLINQWKLEPEARDELYLKKARILANSKKVEDLLDAINEASMVSYGRHYEAAQKVIAHARLQLDIADDLSYLEHAKELASHNDLVSLQMAINEASLIHKERPLYKEANEHIREWNKKLLELQAVRQEHLVH
jgi:hypothetical protein